MLACWYLVLRANYDGLGPLDVDIVRHLQIATDVGSATDFDLVEPMLAPDDDRLPLAGIAGTDGGFSPRSLQAQVVARPAV